MYDDVAVLVGNDDADLHVVEQLFEKIPLELLKI